MSPLLAHAAGIAASTALLALCAQIEKPEIHLLWIALAPWFAALDRSDTWPGVLASAIAMSVGFTFAVFAWFPPAVADYTGASPTVAFFIMPLAAPLLEPQFLAFATVRHWMRGRRASVLGATVAASAAWVATESLAPRLFGNALGHALYAYPSIRQAADLGGVALLSALVLLVNQALLSAAIALRRSPRDAALAAATAVALVAAPTGYGQWRLGQLDRAPSERAPVVAALVQPSLGDYGRLRERDGAFEATRTIVDTNTSLARSALKENDLDLIVWPETVYPTTFGNPKSPDGARFDDAIRRFVEDTDTTLLFGTYQREGDREFNAAVLLSPEATASAPLPAYRKARLFPLTEAVPAWLDTPTLRAYLPWLGTWSAGDGGNVVTLDRPEGGSVQLAPLICRDAVDPSLALEAARRGAELIVTLSNDGWFADTAGANLHLVVSAFRSVETRLPQFRATNSGITAVIDASGTVINRTAPGERTTLVGRLQPGSQVRTLLYAWGDWFGFFAAALAAGLIAATARRSHGR